MRAPATQLDGDRRNPRIGTVAHSIATVAGPDRPQRDTVTGVDTQIERSARLARCQRDQPVAVDDERHRARRDLVERRHPPGGPSTAVEQDLEMTVAFDVETWTAGTSGKKLGSVYRRPIASARAMTTYFQSGYRFIKDREWGLGVRD